MDSIVVKNRKFVLDGLKAHHEDHDTYLATHNGIKYLIRTFREGYEEALNDYKTLKRAGINISRLCFHDDENKILVLDYFPEEDMLTALSKGDLGDNVFEALFKLYRFAKFSKAGLDWKPQNFMLRGTEMFYLPIKIHPFTEESKLENGGIMYWFRGKEGIDLLSKKGFDVSGIAPLDDAAAKKQAVLMFIKHSK